LIGLTGTALTIATYMMRTMVRLRITALLGSLFFLIYGVLGGSLTVVVTECLLVPINAIRLLQFRRQVGQPREAFEPGRYEAAEAKIVELQKEIRRLRAIVDIGAEEAVSRLHRGTRPRSKPFGRSAETLVALAASIRK
jgi:hypothetical protein